MRRPWTLAATARCRLPEGIVTTLRRLAGAARDDQLPLVLIETGTEPLVVLRLADFRDWFGEVAHVTEASIACDASELDAGRSLTRPKRPQGAREAR